MEKRSYSCNVCNITVHTQAEYALHEFSRKHCANLIKAPKNRTETRKEEVRVRKPLPAEEPQQSSVAAAPSGSGKCDHFVLGKTHEKRAEPKECDTDCGPHDQKCGPNPDNRASQAPTVTPYDIFETTTIGKGKRRRTIRFCRVCNAMLLTVPEYETHLKSSTHMLTLKASGLGVSAHFIKAGTHLDPVKPAENVKPKEPVKSAIGLESLKKTIIGTATQNTLPVLYCDVCELLLNSETQYNSHVSGKVHYENMIKKYKQKGKKAPTDNQTRNQLYCYSCKLSLNTLYQFNEHKYGKKHLATCKRLMKMGITIPPEERVDSWRLPRYDHNKKVVYPDSYEQYLAGCDKKGNTASTSAETSDDTDSDSCKSSLNEEEYHPESRHRHEGNRDRGQFNWDKNLKEVEDFMQIGSSRGGDRFDRDSSGKRETRKIEEKRIIGANDSLTCSICNANYTEQRCFEQHLRGENHARMIVEARENGMKDHKILSAVLHDKSYVKADKWGRYSCLSCSITAESVEEFENHVKSYFHKKSEREYKKKRYIEIKFAVRRDRNGKYICSACREGTTTLVDYNLHLHTGRHAYRMKPKKKKQPKQPTTATQTNKRYLMSGMRAMEFGCWIKKCDDGDGTGEESNAPSPVPNLVGESWDTASDDETKVVPKTEPRSSPEVSDQGTKRKNEDEETCMIDLKRIKREKPDSDEDDSTSGVYTPQEYPQTEMMFPRILDPCQLPNPFARALFPQALGFPPGGYQQPPDCPSPWPRFPPSQK